MWTAWTRLRIPTPSAFTKNTNVCMGRNHHGSLFDRFSDGNDHRQSTFAYRALSHCVSCCIDPRFCGNSDHLRHRRTRRKTHKLNTQKIFIDWNDPVNSLASFSPDSDLHSYYTLIQIVFTPSPPPGAVLRPSSAKHDLYWSFSYSKDLLRPRRSKEGTEDHQISNKAAGALLTRSLSRSLQPPRPA